MPDGSKVVLAYNDTQRVPGRRASYTATPNGAAQPSLVERFTYRGGELAQAGFSGTGVTTPYTDTYLHHQDGAPYELIRQTKSAGACGSATCRYWYLLDGPRNMVDRYHYVPTRRVSGRAEHRRGGRRRWSAGLRCSEQKRCSLGHQA